MPTAKLMTEVLELFGPNALQTALFYKNDRALRFELAGGESRVDMFLQAIDRARAVAAAAFTGPDVILVLSAFATDSQTKSVDWQALAGGDLQGLGVDVTGSFDPVHVQAEADEVRVFVACRVPTGCVPKLLWGALAHDLGVQPSLGNWRVYLADPVAGVLLHPYDDRGMDVIGPSTALLAGLYAEFNAWLLDYDRARMAKYFEPSN